MAIPIQNHKLTKEQYIKLFSNPVSGITCDITDNNTRNYPHLVLGWLKNIRYSKSMILRALYFWEKQYDRYNQLLKKAQFNPLFGSNDNKNKENEILKLIMMVHNFPDSFLFSHRHIEEMDVNNYRKFGGSGPALANNLLNKKYNMNFRPQKQTMDPFSIIKTSIGIEFTVFPCEHPYIERQKISKVGITDRGNVYVLHKNGAQKHREMMDIHRKVTGEKN